MRVLEICWLKLVLNGRIDLDVVKVSHAYEKKNSQDKVKLASLPREKSSWYSSRDPLPRTNLPRLKISHGIHSTAMCAPRNELAISRHRSTCCGVCTVTGLKPGNPRWQNQDSYIISEDFQRQTNQRCYGVLDGHGEIGHLVSKRCSQQLCEHFVKSQLDMSLAFRLMQEVELRAWFNDTLWIHTIYL